MIGPSQEYFLRTVGSKKKLEIATSIEAKDRSANRHKKKEKKGRSSIEGLWHRDTPLYPRQTPKMKCILN